MIIETSSSKRLYNFINGIDREVELSLYDWERISIDYVLSEDFIREFKDYVIWEHIPRFQKLSESFILDFIDKVNWNIILQYQRLTEGFIRKMISRIDSNGWMWISRTQKLSESFIRKFKDHVNWYNISHYQKLSEDFIREFKDHVDWIEISKSQKLSEDFMREFKDRGWWYTISKYQSLPENFIKEFQDKFYLEFILAYQKLTESFIEELVKLDEINKYEQYQIKDSWHYKTTEFKKQEVIKTNLYECFDDHFIAYKGIRSDNYSVFNFQYQYFVGNTYESNADYSRDENSFGLSIWTLEKAKGYCDEKIIKVKIKYEDVARVVHNGGKIRCCKFEVLEEVG